MCILMQSILSVEFVAKGCFLINKKAKVKENLLFRGGEYVEGRGDGNYIYVFWRGEKRSDIRRDEGSDCLSCFLISSWTVVVRRDGGM